MNVTTLIDTMQDLAFNRVITTNKERSNYLRFLNLANAELWQIMVNAKPFYEERRIFLNENVNVFDIPQNIYKIKAIFGDIRQLSQCELSQIYNIPDHQYYILNNQVKLNTNYLNTAIDPDDNTLKKYVTLIIIPNLKELVENVLNPAFETDEPQYPLSFHYGLLQGALLYIFISNKGFSEKLQLQNVLWNTVKKEIATYYS